MPTTPETGIVTGSEFDATQTSYAKPKMNPSGGKNVGVLNSETGKQLYISSPLMLTWGMNEWTNEQNGNHTYDMSLQFPREQDSNYGAETNGFLEGLKALEEKVKRDTTETYSREWFNKPKMSAEVVEALWTPMLRYPKDDNGDFDYTRAPSLRVKVPYWDGKFNTELYDMEGECLFPSADESVSPMSLVQKGQNVAVVIQCGGIWFANGKFGMTWRLLQAVVQPRATLKGRCHIQLNTASKNMMRSSTEALEGEAESHDTGAAAAEANDTEEEVDDAPIPEPPKKPKGKRAVKSKKGGE